MKKYIQLMSRLSIGSVAFSVSYWLCAILVGMRFTVPGLCLGLGGFWLGLALCERFVRPRLSEMRRRWPGFARLLDEARDLGGGLIPLAWLIAACIVMGHEAPALSSLSPELQRVIADVERVGDMALLLWMLYAVVGMFARGEAGVWSFAISAAEKVAALTLLPVAFRFFGGDIDALLAWVRTNPEAAIEMAAAVVAVYLAFRATPSRLVVFARGSTSLVVRGYAAAGSRRPRSEREQLQTAAHEAGHALMLAALEPRPTELRVFILRSSGPRDPILGSVQSNLSSQTGTETFLRWSMYMSLAGAVAEHSVTGVRTPGSEEDMAKWQRKARQYLASGFGDVFVATPESDADVKLNGFALNRLLETQRSDLAAFFEKNGELLLELTEAIKSRKELHTDDLTPYLDRVLWVGPVGLVQLESEACERG